MNKAAESFEKLLASGQDSALLRYSLGNAYLSSKPELAAEHFEKALSFDGNYSAAWKLLGKARAACADTAGALEAYSQGIEIAKKNGDVQALKEMTVFLRRLKKAAAQD
ncbi:MAG: hypothetical protein ACU84Q_11075 [Gammaproteobacteria bacterium]